MTGSHASLLSVIVVLSTTLTGKFRHEARPCTKQLLQWRSQPIIFLGVNLLTSEQQYFVWNTASQCTK